MLSFFFIGQVSSQTSTAEKEDKKDIEVLKSGEEQLQEAMDDAEHDYHESKTIDPRSEEEIFRKVDEDIKKHMEQLRKAEKEAKKKEASTPGRR